MRTETLCHRRKAPICPHCGGITTDVEELELPQEDCEVMECGECGEEFAITKYVDVVYTTRPVGGWR